MFSNRDLDRLVLRLKVSERVAKRDVSQAVYDTTESAADEMRRIIETSGTGWIGKWFSATSAGRVDSGQMLGDVTTSHTPLSGTWGWALNGGKAEPYYFYQENGFRHWRSGKNVPPMHALLGSFIKAREELVARLDRLVG